MPCIFTAFVINSVLVRFQNRKSFWPVISLRCYKIWSEDKKSFYSDYNLRNRQKCALNFILENTLSNQNIKQVTPHLWLSSTQFISHLLLLVTTSGLKAKFLPTILKPLSFSVIFTEISWARVFTLVTITTTKKFDTIKHFAAGASSTLLYRSRVDTTTTWPA